MRTRLVLEVDTVERYVIACYFSRVEKSRPRATREQVRRFARAALRAMVDEQVQALRGRQQVTAQRLLAGETGPAPERLTRPDERQLGLL